MLFQNAKKLLFQEVTEDWNHGEKLLDIHMRLQALDPLTYDLTFYEVNGLWRSFSDTHAAGFLTVTDSSFDDFVQWLS